jgi:hypothetical protein
MKLGPSKDFTLFTKLQTFVAVQEAVFSVDEELIMCRVPDSIEVIGIIDTTCAVD